MSKEELAAIRDMMTEHLPKVLEAHNLNMIYFMLTDILAESTRSFCVWEPVREELPSAHLIFRIMQRV